MALADIQKKSSEERKREKRLVHLTNSLGREYLNSGSFRKKTAVEKGNVEYIAKSILDYIFFEEKKELRELHENHIRDFMLTYTPHKLNLSADASQAAPDILDDFIAFLETNGHIKNGEQLRAAVKVHKREFLKLMPKPKTTAKAKKTSTQKKAKSKKASEQEIDIKVGRNDPCPCGSGKKYKKCCGQAK
jgi:uncharacterized protein YchJ